MTRLRHRALAALSHAPRPMVAHVARYLVLRLTTLRSLDLGALDTVLAHLDGAPRRPHASLRDLELAIQIGDALVATARRARVVRQGADTCLSRALARYGLLTEQTHAPVLCIGIDPARVHDAEAMELGHAWVEVHGAPLLAEAVPRLVLSFRHTRTLAVEHGTASPP